MDYLRAAHAGALGNEALGAARRACRLLPQVAVIVGIAVSVAVPVNFANAPGPFPTKLPGASLNLATWTALYDYGYRNVYELGPLLDVKTTRIEFVAK